MIKLAAALAALLLAYPPGADARPSFLWGAATSSYQVEGGIDCSDATKPCNDYDFFNRDPAIRQGILLTSVINQTPIFTAPAGIADNAWDPVVYERDFDSARLLGLNAFRFSLEWARIEPTAPTVNPDGSLTHHWDEAAIRHYVDMVHAMRVRGLTPVLTLNHFTLPIWVLRPPNAPYASDLDAAYLRSFRGWTNPDTVARFVDFVKKVVPYFRDSVDDWLTINEPVGSMVAVGYVAGIWSPGFIGDERKAKQALHNLIEAHVQAYDAISDCSGNPACDDVDADADGVAKRVGFAHAVGATVASPPVDAPNLAAAFNFDYFVTNYFLNAVVNGKEDTNYLNSPDSVQGVDVVSHPEWEHHLDFVGINYYRRFHVFHDALLSFSGTGFLGGNQRTNLYGATEPHELLNDLGWAMYPRGLYELIMRVKNTWNLPVMITENGTPERADGNRAGHIVAHLRQVARAIGDGATVLGYLHWSLMDNWELHENYRPEARFGLLHVDRGRPDLHRELTEGALAYQQVIAESGGDRPTAAAVNSARDKFGELAADGMQYAPPSLTHGRLWQGTTDDGPVTLYLGFVDATRRVTGMLFRHDTQTWHSVDLMIDGDGPFLRERWLDGASMRSQDIRVSYADGRFSFPGSGHIASRIPGTGLWRWRSGESPWGADHFYVSRLEGRYTGKYLTFSSPGDRDRAGCTLFLCLPQVAGANWRPVAPTVSGNTLRLDATGRRGENPFDVTMALGGSDEATSVVAKSGTFATSWAPNILDAHFHATGYLAPAGDRTWIGERDGSTSSKFQFLERRGIVQEFATSADPKYANEHDPHSVMPLRGFDSSHGVVWEAGGRRYSLADPVAQCASPSSCEGIWADIPGRVATRVPERFPPVVAEFPDRTLEADGPGGAGVTLSLPALDLDGDDLAYEWTGAVSSTDPNPSRVLPYGANEVCVEVSNSHTSTKRCATLTVADTRPPVIVINQPEATDYVHAATLTLDYAVTDAGSGVVEVTPSIDGSTTLAGHGLANGQPIDLLTELSLGTHVFEIHARDHAGNEARESVTFAVIATAASIQDAVRRLRADGAIATPGLAGSLLAKLEAAAEAQAAGDCDRAAALYEAFVSQVQAQTGRGIAASAAAILIADAEYLIAHC